MPPFTSSTSPVMKSDSRWIKKLTVIDTTTRKVVRQVGVGKSPHGVWTLDHAPRN
jgi:hypothetical protein